MRELTFPYGGSLPLQPFTRRDEAPFETPDMFIDPSLLSRSDVDQSSPRTDIAPTIAQTNVSRRQTWPASLTHEMDSPGPNTSRATRSGHSRTLSRCSSRSEDTATRAARNRVQKIPPPTKVQIRQKNTTQSQRPEKVVNPEEEAPRVRRTGNLLEWHDNQSLKWSESMHHIVMLASRY